MADKGKGILSGSSSGSGSTPSSQHAQSSVERQVEPLWVHVTVMQAFEGGGGNKRFTCNFCLKAFTGSYTRVKAHLLHISGLGISGCKKVDASLRRQLLKNQEDFDKNKCEAKEKASINIPLFGGFHEDTEKKRKLTLSDYATKSSTSTKGLSNIEKAFNKVGREELDRKVGRFFFSSSIPFNVARNPYFKDMVTSLANCNISGYVAPGSEKLWTIILSEEKGNIQKLLEHKKFAWETSGVSIVSDGWTDIQRRPLINFIAYSVSGPIFFRSVDASGEIKTSSYLKNLFVEVIKEVGPEHVVQIITDNAANCKSVGLSLQCEFPHIFWTPCVAHSLNLALSKLCTPSEDKENPRAKELCFWIEEISLDCLKIRNFIMNHHLLMAIFNKHSKLKLLKVADTRFASLIVMLKRFITIKSALIQMVTDCCWDQYRVNKAEDQAKAQAIKYIILDDCWWDKVNYFVEFTGPIWEMLREVDKDEPMLNKVYEMWDAMIEKVEGIVLKHEGNNGIQQARSSRLSLSEVITSLQRSKIGIQDWTLTDLTVGLYLIYLRRASEGLVEDFQGSHISSDSIVLDLIYHVELAKGAYRENPAALARHSMLREQNILKFVRDSSLLRPGYYIGTDIRNKLVIFGIRGTHTVYDLITDIVTSSDEEVTFEGYSTHFGTAEAARWFLHNELETIRKCLQKHEGFKLRLVGHSLGGAAAALLAIMLRKRSKEELGFSPDIVSSVGFGTPPCVSQELAESCGDFVSTVVLQDDIIPRLSPASLMRLRNEILQTDLTSVIEREDWRTVKDLVTNAKEVVASIQDVARKCIEYANLKTKDVQGASTPQRDRVEQTAVGQPASLQPESKKDGPLLADLFLPGRLYHLKRNVDSDSLGSKRREYYTLLEGHPGVHFRNIILSSNLISDHKCDNHYCALRDVLKGLPTSICH